MSIGTTQTHDLGKRDAFHVPCVLVKTHDTNLTPGMKVSFANKELTDVKEAALDQFADGIVDPFLESVPFYGNAYFWIFLLPGRVAGLRHHFDVTGVDVDHLEPEADLERDGCRGCY